MLLALCDHSASLEDHIRLVTKVQAVLGPGHLDMFYNFFVVLQRIDTLKTKLDEKKKKDSKVEEKIEDCIDNKINYEKEISDQDEVNLFLIFHRSSYLVLLS